MVKPRPPASFPASLVERRTRLADRLESRSTPTEAQLTLHEVLDELQTIDLNQRSTRERQSAERALRMRWASRLFLQAVRAEPHWSRPIDAPHRRSVRPWRLIGLVGIQAGLGIVLLMLVSGALQRGVTSGDGSLTIGFILVAALLVLQAVTGYRCSCVLAARRPPKVTAPRSRCGWIAIASCQRSARRLLPSTNLSRLEMQRRRLL